MNRLAVVTTHPIQYYAPLFRLLSERRNIDIMVFYTWENGAANFDVGFGKEVTWDIPLLDGYQYQFVSNNGDFGRDFRSVRNPGLIRAIEDWGAQAVLFFGWNYYSHLKAMRYFKRKIPVLFRGDSTLLDEQPGMKKYARRLFLRWVYRHVDIALYVGTSNKEYFLAHGLKEGQLVFAPHAIDNDRFDDPKGGFTIAASEWRSELGIAADETVFIFVGKFQEKKDPLLLITAFRQLNRKGIHLILVGNGELEPDVKKEAEGITGIHILPFQNQSRMPIVYRVGDVFCLPSRGPGETWGLAVNEAMACGRPVLVSNRCGCYADLVEIGKNGFVFNAGEEKDLTDKMDILSSLGMDKRSMGLCSFNMIRSWAFDRQASAIEGVLLNQMK